MGMTEDDKRHCCLVEIQETEAKYYKTLEDIEKVGEGLSYGKVYVCVYLCLCTYMYLRMCVCVQWVAGWQCWM